MKKWKKWERSLPKVVLVRRSIPLYQEEIDEIQLHAFGDASGRITRAGDCEVLSSQTRSYDSSVGARVRSHGCQSNR